MDAAITDPKRRAMLLAGGAMGRRIADHDWSMSPLGPVDRWPEELFNAVALILPASFEIVLYWGPDSVAIYNEAYAGVMGRKRDVSPGLPGRELWPEIWDDLGALLAHVYETGETFAAKDHPFTLERHGYSEETFFDISFSAVRAADGTVGGVMCIVSETTERVRAGRVIAEDRQRLSEMFDAAPSFMAVLRGASHVFELVNRSYLRLIGERQDDLIGRPLSAILPEMQEQGYVALLDTVLATGQAYRADGERVMLRRTEDGEPEERLVDFIFQPITDAHGAVTGIFVEGIDVTDRDAAETALSLSRESLALATDAAEIGTWDLDVLTDTLLWSERTKAMFGISPDVPCSMDDFYAGLHPDDRRATAVSFAAALDPDRRALYDVEYRTIGAEDGVIRWVAAKGRGLFENGRCIRAIGTTIDVTRRKAIDDELRESEDRFRVLADTAPALIWLTDANGDILFVNRWFQSLLGIASEEMRRDGWMRLIPPDDRARVGAHRESARGRQAGFGGELRVLDADGRERWVHTEGRPRFHAGQFQGFVGCAVDVTEAHLAADALEQRIAERTCELADANRLLTEQIAERERVEDTLRRMQRLEAIGQLTSGVAHDFNNLLTVVLGNVELLQRGAVKGAPLDDRMSERLQHVRAAAERGAALTAQLLAFARRTKLEAKTVDLNEAVERMRGLLESALGGAIAIHTRLMPGLWPALVDPTQIELIILNLAINARDAMAQGGTLTIETDNVSLRTPERAEDPAAGNYVMVAVGDDGEGMSAEVLAKAFEPFFTTKPTGKGSGLGLAQVFGFARQSGGGVRIDTRLGEGTIVRVYLPRSAGTPGATRERSDRFDVAAADDRTILVLDDDDAVRGVTADSIREAGWRVVEAADGAAALDTLGAESGIALVVADVAMPEMNGVEFARRARTRHPALPILFVTGYADTAALADIGENAIVRKPYRADDLVTRIRDALQGLS